MKNAQQMANELFAITAFSAMAIETEAEAIEKAIEVTVTSLYENGVPLIMIGAIIDVAKRNILNKIREYESIRFGG